MNRIELTDKIKLLAKQSWRERIKSEDASLAYDELTKFPELRVVITNLLTVDFDKFLESIDWIAPRPSTFRINLLNGQSFTLIYTEKSWIAGVEGKKYYLLNLDEEQRASESIARILSYGAVDKGEMGAEIDGAESLDKEKPPKEDKEEEETIEL